MPRDHNINAARVDLFTVKPAKKDRMFYYLTAISLGLLFAACFYPELSLAASLESQLDNVGTLTKGKVKTIGLSAATIGGGIYSVAKGNIKLAGLMVGIGIILGLYLEWLEGGMKLLS